ncbi:MAG: IPT/TIG domain-containing protein, partial [Myxococcales bacterium]|nr:IPT/TIG domain-containing protein [Myxococcales bacterium]
GATLTLRGSGFGADLRVVQVQIGERVAPIRRIADGELQVLIPEDAASGTLRVRVHALEAQARSPLRVLVPVSVSEVEPRSGGPGSIVRIRGAGFSPRTRDNSVTLSGSACEIVEASGELLQIRVPEAASGPFEVQVAGAGGARSRPFVVTSPPIVTGFEPARASPGETLHIRGRRFGTNAALIQVRLGETLLPLDSVSDDHLVVRIPEGAESGPLQVELRMQGLARSEENLEILASVLVHALEPSSLSARQELTIRGVGFPEGRIRALFEGARPVRVQRLGPAELRVRVPRTARSGPVQLTLPDGRVLMTPTLTIE